jgi:hypothetical protein
MPLYAAGQKIRGNEINALPQTFRAAVPSFCPNSNTLRDITGLAFPGDANGWYTVEAILAYHASVAAKIRFAWALPGDYVPGNGAAGTGSWWTALGLSNAATNGVGDLDAVINDSLTLAHNRAGSDSVPMFMQVIAFVMMGPTAGSVRLQFSQQTSNSHNTTIRAGSALRVTKLN